MDAATAARVVLDYSQQVQNEAFDTFIGAQPVPILVAGVNWTPEVRNARQTIEDIEARIERGAIQGQGFDRAIDDSYQAYLQLAGGIERSGSKPTVDDERAASRLISLIGDLGHLAKDQGEPLSAESQQLVRQSMALQWQRNLPDIYGAGAAGGVLAMRQNQRLQALEAWAARPNLRHPDQTIGKTDGGPGQWVYSGQRNGGADYQEQISGVPRGIEYQVAGIKFDSYDKARNVLVDGKDWSRYVLPEAKFWVEEVTSTAMRQLNATQRAGTGASIEWKTSTRDAADAIRVVLKDSGIKGIAVVVVPKRGP